MNANEINIEPLKADLDFLASVLNSARIMTEGFEEAESSFYLESFLAKLDLVETSLCEIGEAIRGRWDKYAKV